MEVDDVGGADAEAFRALYPEAVLTALVEAGARADGRPLARARKPSVAPGAAPRSAASALAQLGSTRVIAAVNPTLVSPGATTGGAELAVAVEVALGAEPDLAAAAARAEELAAPLERDLRAGLRLDTCVVDLPPGAEPHAWRLAVDVLVFSCDGAVADCALLAAVAALRALELPALEDSGSGGTLRAQAPGAAAGRRLDWEDDAPVGLTAALYKGRLLVDPTAEEERVAEALIRVVAGADGAVLAVHKPGGSADASDARLVECVAAAQLRQKECAAALAEALPSS